MHTIILAGGTGTRLWPLSRQAYPKQFIKFDAFGNYSLFQLSLLRAAKVSPVAQILIVTNTNHRFTALGQSKETGIPIEEHQIIPEPEARNTLPAIALAMQQVSAKAFIMPSDHYIGNFSSILDQIMDAEKLADEGLVTFGISPTSPHTGYGYIKAEGNEVREFKEKPDQETAKEYVAKGYLWNAGMFLFEKHRFETELQTHHPEIKELLQTEDELSRLYERMPTISVDHGLLEKSDRVLTVPLSNPDWSDVGSFSALAQLLPADHRNNQGANGLFYESSNTFVHAPQKKLVVTYGIEDVSIVDTEDALLVCAKDHTEKVKKIAEDLQTKQDERAYQHTTVYRPWGHYRLLQEGVTNEGTYHKTKELYVNPGAMLSIQSHNYRNENWTVIEGQAYVLNDTFEGEVGPTENVFIPAGNIHRLGNKRDTPVRVIEVQTGSYLREDDIYRYEDIYGR